MRGWLLRKNFINLRDAAMTLQCAWREKRKSHSTPAPKRSLESTKQRETAYTEESNTSGLGQKRKGFESNIFHVPSTSPPSGSPYTIPDTHLDNSALSRLNSHDLTEVEAAATLQAATRGMLARKAFETMKKQAIASLVIQRSMGRWWGSQQKK